MQEDTFSLKANLWECFSYAFISNLGYSTRRIHFYSSQISNSILHETFHALWDMLFVTWYFKWQRKSIKGKHIKSRDMYFQQDLNSTFTVLSNIQIIERELTSSKISVLLFISLKYGAWEHRFSPVLCGEFLLMIWNNRFTSLIIQNQLASPWFIYTFDRLIKNFGVNLRLIMLFTTCKMGICLWVIDFWFGRGISS